MEIIHVKDKGFFIEKSSDEKENYSRINVYEGVFIADHTFVSEELRGQGYRKLIQ